MIEMTRKGVGEVYREYYDKMAEKGKSRRLCEILATIYTRRYFDTVLDIYNGEHNPKHKKEHGELFRITYQEFYDKARENYYAYKNEPLIRYLAATYAEAYEEKRREHGEIRYALDFAEVYNNKKRKSLGSLNVRNVEAFGKVTSSSFQRYLNMPGIKRMNWFLNRDAELYYFYFTKESDKKMIILEPSEEMVDYIRKYLPNGAWRE